MSSRVWASEMNEYLQGNAVFKGFVVSPNVSGSHLKVAVTAPGQSTPKQFWEPGDDRHQPRDTTPLKC